MNRKWLKISIVLVAIVALAATAVVASAAWPGGGRGQGFGVGPDGSLLSVAAETLSMEQADLVTELQAGKTIADVAAEKGVEVSAIVDAFVAVHADNLANAVTNGWLTQEQADARLELLKTNLTARLSEAFDPRGYGFTDEDGDGVCDFCEAYGMGQGRGMMGPRGNFNGMGRGMMGPRGGNGIGRGGMWGNGAQGSQNNGANS